MKKPFLYLALFFMYSTANAQNDFAWWNTIHNWDGVTPWQNYINFSTSSMGPNALPVPDITNGFVDSTVNVEVGGSYHYSRGDKTTDIFTRAFCPLTGRKAGLEFYAVPLEWFETDSFTRDIRAARERDGKGSSGGDIYLSTFVQLLSGKKFPDIMLRIALRTASGTNLRNARFTDAPGYFIDLSAGKNYLIAADRFILRPFIMSGFYSYQTNNFDQPQNDCFLYGGGTSFYSKKITITNSIGGYIGYLKNGDKPLVYRFEFTGKISSYFFLKANYQWGINDFPFSTYRVGVIVKSYR